MTLHGFGADPNSILQTQSSVATTEGSVGTGLPRVTSTTVTFTGASGLGLHGTSTTIFTVTGAVLIEYIAGRVTTNLTGASATVTLGTTNKTTVFIGTTTATGLVTTAENWVSTTPTQGAIAVPTACQNTVVSENVILSSTHASADVTGGVIEINAIWRPLTPGATLV